ncbi:hypothetical protein [uncultured Enterococcus sp.]|uniref:hypothetical protein n=1 Tax=uncultured Enterococcus sp. TaxID=167972 RepID=UPI002AA6C23B|nr:hypothetical protein [uncultured Enterococcus sp.]
MYLLRPEDCMVRPTEGIFSGMSCLSYRFYIIHFPEIARQSLMYRYNRLSAAKADAKKAGYRGAMFPWQSGLDGTEQSQELHLNPISGEWGEGPQPPSASCIFGNRL